MLKLAIEQMRQRKHLLVLVVVTVCLIVLVIGQTNQNKPLDNIDDTYEPIVSLPIIEEPEYTLPEVLPEDEVEIEKDPLEEFNKIEDVRITYYCAEKYPHICNAGPPYTTARGNEVIPNYTCAVDRKVIPLGSTVIVDYGDGVLHEYYADDVGGAIKGNRVDIAVETHEQALNCGVKYATVYWK